MIYVAIHVTLTDSSQTPSNSRKAVSHEHDTVHPSASPSNMDMDVDKV